jgi:hypothetical protein
MGPLLEPTVADSERKFRFSELVMKCNFIVGIAFAAMAASTAMAADVDFKAAPYMPLRSESTTNSIERPSI